MSTQPVNADVVIVGAGFSGIAAGRELSNLGQKTIIVEGRDRIGGRTWTKESPIGLNLEMGGTWVHPSMAHVWSEINRYNIALHITPFAQKAWWRAGQQINSGTPDDLACLVDVGMNEFLPQAGEAFPFPHTPYPLTDLARQLDAKSAADVIETLDLTEEQRSVLDGIWALHFNSVSSRGGFLTALRWAALANNDWRYLAEITERYKLVNGTQELINAMHRDSQAQVVLNTTVEAITEDEQGVTITTSEGQSYRAKHVIVTAPVNALKNITFTGPYDPASLGIAEEGQAANGLKVWMRVKGNLEPFHCLGTSEDTFVWIQYETELDGDSVLVAFSPDATRIDGNNIDEVTQALQVFRPDLEVLEVDSHDWVADPFAQQTWVIYRPNQLSADAETLHTKNTRIWLAGADYAHGWTSFIDGAIEAGIKTARNIYRGENK